jgi:hypothetical protein
VFQRLKFIFIFVFIIFFFGCKNIDSGTQISEGYVIYKVKTIDKENWMVNFAPNEMKLSFSKGLYAAEMSSMGGIFRSSFIADSIKKTFIQVVKFWKDKMYSIQGKDEVFIENSLIGKYNLVSTDDKKDIAGYPCNKILAINSSTNDTSVLWTTEKIGIKYPEFAMPFEGVTGFPMCYTMVKFGIKLNFEAEKVKAEKINESIFKTPNGFTKVSPDSIANFFLKFKS